VVTANKKLIAYRGLELQKLAQEKHCSLLYGAAVAGGVPVIPALQQGLAGDEIVKLEGILNGTCNFILSKMEKGAEFAEVLAEAQELGYAERDPTEDVDGYDARAKLVILARIGLRADVAPNEISCRTIRSVSSADFDYAKELQCTIRQIARAEMRDGALLASVGPMLVKQSSPLAWSQGTEQVVIRPPSLSSPIFWPSLTAPAASISRRRRYPQAANFVCPITFASWSLIVRGSSPKLPATLQPSRSISAPSCKSPTILPTTQSSS
jgi:homoserine dehydrogenase